MKLKLLLMLIGAVLISGCIAQPAPETPTGPICGDNVCESGENYSTCPSDCEPALYQPKETDLRIGSYEWWDIANVPQKLRWVDISIECNTSPNECEFDVYYDGKELPNVTSSTNEGYASCNCKEDCPYGCVGLVADFRCLPLTISMTMNETKAHTIEICLVRCLDAIRNLRDVTPVCKSTTIQPY